MIAQPRRRGAISRHTMGVAAYRETHRVTTRIFTSLSNPSSIKHSCSPSLACTSVPIRMVPATAQR
jgi:hypothetical protein